MFFNAVFAFAGQSVHSLECFGQVLTSFLKIWYDGRHPPTTVDELTQFVCLYWQLHILQCFYVPGIENVTLAVDNASTPLDAP